MEGNVIEKEQGQMEVKKRVKEGNTQQKEVRPRAESSEKATHNRRCIYNNISNTVIWLKDYSNKAKVLLHVGKDIGFPEVANEPGEGMITIFMNMEKRDKRSKQKWKRG